MFRNPYIVKIHFHRYVTVAMQAISHGNYEHINSALFAEISLYSLIYEKVIG